MFAEPIARVVRASRRLDRTVYVALVVLGVLYAAAVLAPLIAPYGPAQQLDIVSLNSRPPSAAHWFGTDRYSRDVFTRVLYGARLSLSVATLAVLLAAVLGTTYGLVAGTARPWVDALLMRALDTALAVPRVLLLIAVLALWSPVPLGALILLLGFTGWFEVARLVRAETLGMRERDFVTAARSLGAGRWRVMRRHLLPNVLGPVIVATALNIGNLIVLEAGLSFIGVGVHEPDASWGTMFHDATTAFAGTWWVALFPGIAIVLTVLCFNVVGDGLRKLLDPRQLPRTQSGTRAAVVLPIATGSPADA